MAETIEDGLNWAARQLNTAWRHTSLLNPRDEANVYGGISAAKASIMGGWAAIRVLEEERVQTGLLKQQIQFMQQQNMLLQQQNMLLQQQNQLLQQNIQPALQPVQQQTPQA